MNDSIEPNHLPASCEQPQTRTASALPHAGMVWMAGGSFQMGSDCHYPEERPVHRVSVDGFWIDRAPVTNREFRRFVEATGYVTSAEIALTRLIILAPDPTCSGRAPWLLRRRATASST